jgi:hypothetical protein
MFLEVLTDSRQFDFERYVDFRKDVTAPNPRELEKMRARECSITLQERVNKGISYEGRMTYPAVKITSLVALTSYTFPPCSNSTPVAVASPLGSTSEERSTRRVIAVTSTVKFERPAFGL